MSLPIELLSENFVKTRNITTNTAYEIYEIDAVDLLCPARFDLAAKIAYIEAYEKNANMDFANELYRKHIEAFSEGYFVEPGDKEKTSLEKFIATFSELIEDIKLHGFDKEKSLIPVGRNNTILDGAHRTACAIYFKKRVTVIRFPDLDVNFGYEFFRKRNLSEEMLDYMATIYSRWSSSRLYMACIWPVADKGKLEDAISIIRDEQNVVYRTDIDLKKNGLRNLMIQIYQHQDWIGDIEGHFEGVMGKVESCYAPLLPTTAVMFEGGAIEQILEMKEKIRALYGIGKHAIHISDTNNETVLMASVLYQNSSRHALNYGKPDTFANSFLFFKENRSTGIFFSPSATLAYYGISDHGELSSKAIVVNPNNPRTYFVFDGLLLPSLEYIKNNRPQNISTEDYKALEILANETLGNLSLKRKIQDLKTMYMWKSAAIILKVKQIAMVITQKVGVYDMLHNLYHRGK